MTRAPDSVITPQKLSITLGKKIKAYQLHYEIADYVLFHKVVRNEPQVSAVSV